MLCGIAIALAGCPSDPNKNSMLIGSGGGTTGSPGSGGGVGNPGSGGSTVGTGMGPIIGTPIVTFDTMATGTAGFALDAYHDTVQKNLTDPATGASPAPTIAFDDTQGSPTAGSLMVTAPYFGASQYVDIQKSIQTSPQNWTNKTMHVRIKLTSGTFRSGGVQLYVKTGTLFVFGGTYANLTAALNTWQEFTLNITAPLVTITGYDPTNIVSYGLQINSGSAGTTQMPVTFSVDSFSIDPPLPAMTMDAAADRSSDVAAGDAVGDVVATDLAATDLVTSDGGTADSATDAATE
jgi:hypothetical protein